MKKDKQPLFNAFSVRRLLLACQIYDCDQVDRILDSLSEYGCEEYRREEFLEALAKNALSILNREIHRDVKIIQEIFSLRLAIVPLVFGIKGSNKSSVIIDLAYYLNIPNVVSTNTVRETLRIYRNEGPRDAMERDCLSYSNYLADSREVSKGIRIDIEKAIKQGKSIILCGHNLFLPHIFELHSSGLFPAPTLTPTGTGEASENTDSLPLYYLPSADKDLASLLFVPVLLKADLEKARAEPETKLALQALQDEIISSSLNNSLNWPLHIVPHDPDNPQLTSRRIHQIVIESLKKAATPQNMCMHANMHDFPAKTN